MKFEEALAAMRDGKKVRYVGANEHWFLHIEGCRIVNQKGSEFPLSSTSVVNYDWEIYDKPKWEPRKGEWHVNILGDVTRNCELKEEIIGFGMARQTREQTEKARDRMRIFNRLLAYADEHAPDYNPDIERINWYVNFHREKRKWWADYGTYKIAGCVYMPEGVAKKLADDLNSGSVVL